MGLMSAPLIQNETLILCKKQKKNKPKKTQYVMKQFFLWTNEELK